MTNTKKTLLMSVAAAALVAGLSVASAQAPTASPGQQGAPAEKMAPAMKDTTGQASPAARSSDPKADGKMDKGAQAPAPASKSTTGQAATESKDGMKSPPGKSSTEMKADTKTKADAKTNAEMPAKSSEKAGDTKPTTTGQGAAGTAASLSTEQRTTIRTVISKQNVKPVTNVNFSISVGTRVPRTVQFHPVPAELVTIYPSWRGYDYFLVGDQIIVVNPRTLDIVAVLDA